MSKGWKEYIESRLQKIVAFQVLFGFTFKILLLLQYCLLINRCLPSNSFLDVLRTLGEYWNQELILECVFFILLTPLSCCCRIVLHAVLFTRNELWAAGFHGFCDVWVNGLTVFGLSKRIKKINGDAKICMLRAWVRSGFILKAILCLLPAHCQALPGTVAHVVVTTPPWGNWLWSSFHWWANSDSKTCSSFPEVARLTGDSAGTWVHSRLHWPRAPALGPCCRQSRGALGVSFHCGVPGPLKPLKLTATSPEAWLLAESWGGWSCPGSFLCGWLLFYFPFWWCPGLGRGVGGSPSGRVEAPSEGVLLRSWGWVGMVPLSEAPTPWSHSGCQGWNVASSALVFTHFWALSFWVIFGGFSGIYSYCMVSNFQCFHFFSFLKPTSSADEKYKWKEY